MPGRGFQSFGREHSILNFSASRIVWADTANRLDDESYGNRDKKQVADIACEKDKLKVLIPVKHPSQKAVGK